MSMDQDGVQGIGEDGSRVVTGGASVRSVNGVTFVDHQRSGMARKSTLPESIQLRMLVSGLTICLNQVPVGWAGLYATLAEAVAYVEGKRRCAYVAEGRDKCQAELFGGDPG